MFQRIFHIIFFVSSIMVTEFAIAFMAYNDIVIEYPIEDSGESEEKDSKEEKEEKRLEEIEFHIENKEPIKTYNFIPHIEMLFCQANLEVVIPPPEV